MVLLIQLVLILNPIIVNIHAKYSYSCNKQDSCMVSTIYQKLVWDSLNVTFRIDQEKECSNQMFFVFDIFFKPRKSSILNNQILHKSFLFLVKKRSSRVSLSFSNLKGFEVDLFGTYSTETNKKLISIILNIYDSKLDLYENGQIKTECTKTNSNKNTSSLFNLILEINFLHGIKYQKQICPFIFDYLKCQELKVYFLINSYYKQNILSFSNISNQMINIQINRFVILDAHDINIDSRLFSWQVFQHTNQFAIYGRLNSIQKNLFTPFKHLKLIQLDILYARKFLSTFGIDWIRCLNADLDIDTKNKSQFRTYSNRAINININFHPDQIPYSKYSINFLFPDEDFCIYSRFPFNQMIVISIYDEYYPIKPYEQNFTCTFAWLTQNYSLFNLNYLYSPFDLNSLLKSCNFDLMLKNCIKLNSSLIPKDPLDIQNSIVLYDFILIIFATPFVCLLGLILNITSLYLLFKKKTIKFFKEKHYQYLKANFLLGLVFFLISLLGLINECPFNQGLFCSSIRKLISIQYFKIIFIDFFACILKFSLNCTTLAITLARLVLVGKTHSKFIIWFARLSSRKFVLFSFLIASILCAIKLFYHKVNEFDPDQEYPIEYFEIYANFTSSFFVFYLIKWLNLIPDLINSFLFPIMSLVLDILLLKKLRKTLAISLEIKLNSSTVTKMNKNKNEYTSLRILGFTILNLSINFALRIPELFVPVYMFIGYFSYVNVTVVYSSFENFILQFCFKFSFTRFWLHLTNCTYMISLIFNFFIYFYTDIKFKYAFKNFLL